MSQTDDRVLIQGAMYLSRDTKYVFVTSYLQGAFHSFKGTFGVLIRDPIKETIVTAYFFCESMYPAGVLPESPQEFKFGCCHKEKCKVLSAYLIPGDVGE